MTFETRYKPALFGALYIGLLSGLPLIGAGNCLCCLWVVTGGLLTVYLQQQAIEAPIETGEAVIGALLAGLGGALLAVFLMLLVVATFGPYQQRIVSNLLLRLTENMPNIPPETRSQIDEMSRQNSGGHVAVVFLQACVMVPVFAVMSMLGGLLGLAFFRKKSAEPLTPGVTRL